jgi:hypothetical protein
LKLLVVAQLDSRLRVRVSPSDIVQEAFFEAIAIQSIPRPFDGRVRGVAAADSGQ